MIDNKLIEQIQSRAAFIAYEGESEEVTRAAHLIINDCNKLLATEWVCPASEGCNGCKHAEPHTHRKDYCDTPCGSRALPCVPAAYLQDSSEEPTP